MRLIIPMTKKEAFHAPKVFHARLAQLKIFINPIEFSEIIVNDLLIKGDYLIKYENSSYSIYSK